MAERLACCPTVLRTSSLLYIHLSCRFRPLKICIIPAALIADSNNVHCSTPASNRSASATASRRQRSNNVVLRRIFNINSARCFTGNSLAALVGEAILHISMGNNADTHGQKLIFQWDHGLERMDG